MFNGFNGIIGKEDLVDNPTARVPVCLCLDVSYSMEGLPINELNKGVSLFYEAIKEDEVAAYSAEICIVTFGGFGAQCVSEFSSLQSNPYPPILSAAGGTPMGEAVNMGLDKLEERKQLYKDVGLDYFQPWLILMTDGAPNGLQSEFDRAVQRTVEMVENKKLTIFPIAIGPQANMNTLSLFSPERTPLKLQGLKFSEFFAWLSQSVAKTSQSIPGEKIKLDLEGIKGWAEL